MASSVSSLDMPPTDFDISVIFEHGVISVAVENCNLCGSSGKTFYCMNCVRAGKFHRRGEDDFENRYEQKLKQWQRKQRDREQWYSKLQETLKAKVGKETKICLAIQTKERVELLKKAIDAEKEKLQKGRSQLAAAQEDRCQREAHRLRQQERLENVLARIAKRNVHVKDAMTELTNAEEQLAHIRTRHLQDLLTYIFPISEVMPKSIDNDSPTQSTVSALAEARHTSYIHGKWVFTDNSGEQQYRIVQPTIPGSGDYSAYSVWIEENKTAIPSEDEEIFHYNAAYTYTAALAYTTQLVTLIAYFLDVHRARRLCYSEFCGEQLSEMHFQRLVTRLNHNVLHLSFSQKVDPEQLHPKHTIHNIITLLKAPQLGRVQPYDVHPELMQSIDEMYQLGGETYDLDLELTELDPSKTQEDEVDGATGGMEHDWEQVPGTLPEVDAGASSPHAQGITSYIRGQTLDRHGNRDTLTSTSMAGGLMTSAVGSMMSMWRAATGGKS